LRKQTDDYELIDKDFDEFIRRGRETLKQEKLKQITERKTA